MLTSRLFVFLMVSRKEDDPRDGGLVKKRGRRGKGEKEERERRERGRGEREGEREGERGEGREKRGEKEKNNEEGDNVIAHNKQEKMSCEVSHANTAWELRACYQTNRQSHTNHGKH